MSERTEGDAAASHGCAGEPPRVGGRRRRLTLAPRPWVAALAGEEKEEVRPVVFCRFGRGTLVGETSEPRVLERRFIVDLAV